MTTHNCDDCYSFFEAALPKDTFNVIRGRILYLPLSGERSTIPPPQQLPPVPAPASSSYITDAQALDPSVSITPAIFVPNASQDAGREDEIAVTESEMSEDWDETSGDEVEMADFEGDASDSSEDDDMSGFEEVGDAAPPAQPLPTAPQAPLPAPLPPPSPQAAPLVHFTHNHGMKPRLMMNFPHRVVDPFLVLAPDASERSIRDKTRLPLFTGVTTPSKLAAGATPERMEDFRSGLEYQCPICESNFGTSDGCRLHFGSCADRNGNPTGRRWQDIRRVYGPWPEVEVVYGGRMGKRHSRE